MMKWVFSGLVFLSVVFGVLNGRMDHVTTAAIRDCGEAVELTLALMGSMCLWSGFMHIAERAGLTQSISNLFGPLIRLLFERMSTQSAAAKAICLNITANLLGLGNAATPLGIMAMREMAKESPKGVASNNMALFVVLNTASLQLIPTTTALLRAETGSAAPLDILPAVWLASLASVVSGILAAKLLSRNTWGDVRL